MTQAVAVATAAISLTVALLIIVPVRFALSTAIDSGTVRTVPLLSISVRADMTPSVIITGTVALGVSFVTVRCVTTVAAVAIGSVSFTTVALALDLRARLAMISLVTANSRALILINPLGFNTSRVAVATDHVVSLLLDSSDSVATVVNTTVAVMALVVLDIAVGIDQGSLLGILLHTVLNGTETADATKAVESAKTLASTVMTMASADEANTESIPVDTVAKITNVVKLAVSITVMVTVAVAKISGSVETAESMSGVVVALATEVDTLHATDVTKSRQTAANVIDVVECGERGDGALAVTEA